MAVNIILAVIGMILGAASLGWGGWLAGGVVGFLVGQVIRLSGQVKTLTRDVAFLQKLQLQQREQDTNTPDEMQPLLKPAPKLVAQPVGDTLQVARVPLAERINQLETPPPEVATVDVALGPLNAPDSGRAHAEQPMYRQSGPTKAPAFEPNPVDKLFAAIGRFFTEGNPIVRVGMVVMFFGLSFLVKYAAGEGFIPLELRLAVVAFIALALVVIGWKTRTKEGGYGLVLQGGGVAAFYLTVFAALKLYSLLPPSVALLLMLVMVILGTALAVLQNAQVLALMATAGGFLSPILTSDGSGNHVSLFSFYLLLNIGILAIAWFKTWRLLNWVGFVFTFVITSVWGVLRYEPELYASTQPFLLAFFALYLTVSILFSIKQPPKLTGLVDGSLVFGLPIVAFGLQAALLKHTEFGLASSAIALAALYFLLARLLWVKYQQVQRVLVESFVALGATFATLAIPLALDAEWTSATWALEAAGLIWIGLRQQRLLPRVAGYLLHLAAALSLLRAGVETGTTPIVSGDFIGLVILSASALGIAYLFHLFAQQVKPGEKRMGFIALVVGWLWWLFAGMFELIEHLPSNYVFAAVIAFFALSCFALLKLGQKLTWTQTIHIGFWLLPLTVLWVAACALISLVENGNLHPAKGLGLVSLSLFVVVQYCFLSQQRAHSRQWLLRGHHIGMAWFLCALIFWEAAWWQARFDWQGVPALMLWFACLALPLIALAQLTQKSIWPFTQHAQDYTNIVPVPLVFLLLLWFLHACSHSGVTGFGYIPVLNLLDLTQLTAIVLLGFIIKRNIVNMALASNELRYGILGGAVFIWLNLVLLRSVHHFSEVAYQPWALWYSPMVQMGLSILWSLCALAVMSQSRRVKNRQLWILGAGLLALVVIKLFTQDLGGSGTLARIVSFVVVGGLMLLIGYVSPMPAKRLIAGVAAEETAKETKENSKDN